MSFPHCAAQVTTFPYVILAHALRFFKVPYIFSTEKNVLSEFRMNFKCPFLVFNLSKYLQNLISNLVCSQILAYVEIEEKLFFENHSWQH